MIQKARETFESSLKYLNEINFELISKMRTISGSRIMMKFQEAL